MKDIAPSILQEVPPSRLAKVGSSPDTQRSAPSVNIQLLPVELLLYIFSLYGRAALVPTRRHIHCWARGEVEGPGEAKETIHWGGESGWVPLMLVCRSWRELALATPSLWRTVDVYKNTRWLALALDRSRDATLELFFHHVLTARAAVPMILPHARRVSKFVLPPLDVAMDWHPDYLSPNITPFLPLLRTNMPDLTELTLSVDYVEHGTDNMVPSSTQLDLSTTHLPSLRILRLSCVRVPWCPQILSKLTSLDLRVCALDGAPFSCEHFLDVLEGLHVLENLRLMDMFVSTTLAPDALAAGTPGSHRAVALPQLRRLVLEDHPPVIRWLLSCLMFAGCISVNIIGWLPRDVDLERFRGGYHALLPPPPLQSRFFPTTIPTHGKIDIWRASARLSVWSDAQAKLTIELRSYRHYDWDFYFLEGIREFQRLFGEFPLETLHVSGGFDKLSTSQWVGLLKGFPEIRGLELWGDGAVAPLLHALKGTPFAGPDDAAGDGSSTPGEDPLHPLCPRLTQLSLDCLDYEIGDIELLVATLHRRASLGLPKMERVDLSLTLEDYRDEYEEEVETYAAELRRLCGAYPPFR